MTFVPAESSATNVEADLYIVIHRGRLLCRLDQTWQPLATNIIESFDTPDHRHYLGTLNQRHCVAVFFKQKQEPVVDGFEWRDLRSQLGQVSEEYFQLAGRALQITRWYRDHQFCGACGSRTREAKTDRALVCRECEARFYPRISPCVIGLIRRGRQCLLARGTRTPEGMFSTLAGFVEPGETAEQAFAREVKEEVGLEISNIRYHSSQPWPFPGQMMIGFHADYAAGELLLDEKEIIEAAWFDIEDLPMTPPLGTIAGQLIDSFVKEILT